jgi:ABC-type uncharacterized transport system permease subunit
MSAPRSLRLFEKRMAPARSLTARAAATGIAIVAALVITSLLFASYGISPWAAYYALLHEPFTTLRGFGYSLLKATPLTFIALGTVLSWRSGFNYLGFEGCFMVGAAAASWLALATAEGGMIGPLSPYLFFPAVVIVCTVAGGTWAGIVGVLRARFKGNEVLISLMMNYVAIFLVQYLVSGPMRAPGSLPETSQLPRPTWLPFVLPGTRAHAGLLLAIVAVGAVWLLLRRMPLGYELIVTGLSPAAARYARIPVGTRIVQAAFGAGALGGLAGAAEVLGVQHRLMDGISGGVGFVGIIVALLARLNPLAVMPTALLYGGMTVGADAMQRRANIPSSITFILQSLIVLLILASDLLLRYRFNPAALKREQPKDVAAEISQ